MSQQDEFGRLFQTLTGNPEPFPWQRALFERFREGKIERALDIPTGLGKTAVIAVWLAARVKKAEVPRRLVYIVDRRAVVDQATGVAETLRDAVEKNSDLKTVLELGIRSLPISTLRGQHVDNRKWLEDPSLPAIILGTIDMIGSRLLFEGYGVSRKMRPYHAGLLGADTLVVLDEAHLVPPFEMLLESIASGTFGPKAKGPVPEFRLMSLSATGRKRTGVPFTLTAEDLKHPVVKQRLEATKLLSVRRLGEDEGLAQALAEEAWKLTAQGTAPLRVIVFCDKREVASEAKKAVELLAKGNKPEDRPARDIETELFVGGRRIQERKIAADKLASLGFIAGSSVARHKPAFVFATSAGEVGVDLDADHMVSDLVAWDRMVQRLGRVNRLGKRAARVIVLLDAGPKPSKAVKEARKKAEGTRTVKEKEAIASHQRKVETVLATQIIWEKPLKRLPQAGDEFDASPGAIRCLRGQAGPASPGCLEADTPLREELRRILEEASTREPLRPELTRPLVDAWSMTSLKEHTGRPEVAPWLRGWVDEELQTAVVWRAHLPTRASGEVGKAEIEAFFEAAPYTSEVLETETWRVRDWLLKRAASVADVIGKSEVVAFVLRPSGDLRKSLRLEELLSDRKDSDKERQKELFRLLAEKTLIVDARLRGLSDGLLENGGNTAPPTLDNDPAWVPAPPFRVRQLGVAAEPRWQVVHQFVKDAPEHGEPSEGLVVEKRRGDTTTEESRGVGNAQLLAEHQREAERLAGKLAAGLGLGADHTKMLRIAARLHDEGKRAPRWQRAFNAPLDKQIYAKTCGPVNVALLDGYRHEFRSVEDAKNDAEFEGLPPGLKELCLHLIAAHHGYARPVIGTGGWDGRPPSMLVGLAREVAERFARLQREWGPWGLAWWESLLRAVDAQASRENDDRGGEA